MPPKVSHASPLLLSFCPEVREAELKIFQVELVEKGGMTFSLWDFCPCFSRCRLSE